MWVLVLAGAAQAVPVDLVYVLPFRTRAVRVSVEEVAQPGTTPDAATPLSPAHPWLYGGLRASAPVHEPDGPIAVVLEGGLDTWAFHWNHGDVGFDAFVWEPYALGGIRMAHAGSGDVHGYTTLSGGVQVGVLDPTPPFRPVVAPAVRLGVATGVAAGKRATKLLLEARANVVARGDHYEGVTESGAGRLHWTWNPGSLSLGLAAGVRFQ